MGGEEVSTQTLNAERTSWYGHRGEVLLPNSKHCEAGTRHAARGVGRKYPLTSGVDIYYFISTIYFV